MTRGLRRLSAEQSRQTGSHVLWRRRLGGRDNFARAESDLYMGNTVKDGGFGKFVHKRMPAEIDMQLVIRMNRDTLYSGAIFDLDAGPVRFHRARRRVKGGRRVLDFLGLPWDDRCLKFHQNRRVIASSSRDQVRRPIYTSSVDRWKHYERHIPDLTTLAAL